MRKRKPEGDWTKFFGIGEYRTLKRAGEAPSEGSNQVREAPQQDVRQVAEAPRQNLREMINERKLRLVVPYLDCNYGIVTFGRVPEHMRTIDGKHVRQHLENAGIVDAKLYITEKGKTWLGLTAQP